MEKENTVSEADVSIPYLTVDTMEPMAVQPATRTSRTNPCTHGGAIEDVLTRGRKRTGTVRCLEGGEIMKDPHRRH